MQRALLFLIALLSGAAGARAQDAHPVFPEAPRLERLPNGLTVVTLRWNSPGIAAYYTLVRVGSRDEVEAGKTGFAHLFEHMMFRGTERFPEEVYERTMQSFGADHNAWTTDDYTLYAITLPAPALPQLIEMEADRFQHLSYSEEQFRTETGAVLGEYNTVASNPAERMVETIFGMAFTRHTYGHTTMGKLQDICRMPELFEHSRSFFRRFYTPDNAILFAVGDVDHAQVMELVRRHYGGWRGRRDRPRIPVEPQPAAGASRHLEWRGSTPPRMMIGYRIPAFDPARRASLRESAALRVVHGLAFHESSPLYQRLVVDERSVLELGSWDTTLRRDPFLFFIEATLAPGTSFDPVLGAIQEELGRIGRGEVPSARIDAVKSHIRYATVASLETPADAAELLASFVAAGGSVEGLPGYLDTLAAVTPDEVAAAARRHLVEGRRYVVTLSPSAEAPEGPTCESLGVER